MVKEDRSGWVAVAPEFAAAKKKEPEITPAKNAYQYFQKDVSDEVKAEMMGQKFDVGQFSRRMRDRWNQLPEDEKEVYEEQARVDMMRFNSESHLADVAAMERKRKLQEERENVVIYDNADGKKSTRRAIHKQQRKQEKRDRKKQSAADSKALGDWNSDMEDEEEDDFSADSDSDDSTKKKKKPAAPRNVSAAVQARRDKAKKEKEDKEEYIANRQSDLRKDRANQAKRRLDFLLKQSDIFSHFGGVQEESAKLGSKVSTTAVKDGARRTDDEKADEADMEGQDEELTTYLTSQPTTIGFGKMRPYQLEGLNWMVRLQENGVNGILADEMGLGKTLQSISVLVYMMEYQQVNGPHLVVVPKSTLSNWMNEIKRWAPELTAVKFHGNKEERDEITKNLMEPATRDENRTWHVCVTTYEVCNIDRNILNKFAWSYLIIDEAHRLKNEASTFSKTIRSFETRYRLLLTGTPLQNNLHELWALLNFLVPDVFANAEQFDEWFNLDIDDAQEKNKLIMQLHKILRPFMLRRLKADVEKNLPPKHETILYTGMSALQKKLYRDILLRDFEALQGQGASGSRSALLNIVMQLRKCAGHPYLFPGVEDRTLPPLGEHLVENCGKMVLLDKLLKRLKERGHRVLLFTQMTRILDIMEDYMVMRQFQYCRIDGNTDHGLREEYIDAYNAPNSEKFIFLLSTRAGGLGINLQTADIVILYDSDWNPQADLQAQDRAHRIGQKREVQVFRFVTEHTIEEKVVERAQQKLKLDAMVVQQGRLKDKDKLSRDDLLAAVRFGADKVFKSKDSSITDDDIDLILDAGKKKTQEMNEKLQNAEKGDMLDFKLDGGGLSAQTFEGVDYAKAALAQAELIGIMDIGKRERRTVAYNENQLYQQQIAAMTGPKKPKKKKAFKLPKNLRLPRMEEWQMYDRAALNKIQEEEEAAFRQLPEEEQKLATQKPSDEKPPDEKPPGDEENQEGEKEPQKPFELPPLISEERQAEKEKLLAEGFSNWARQHYSAFLRGSAKFGRTQLDKISVEVGKSVDDVKKFADAFWDENLGKARFSENEHDRVVKLIERGEKKIEDLKGIVRGTAVLISMFDNPWEELEFTYAHTKDKMFTTDEDRHLLCWAHKFGHGQWEAVKMAIRRSPSFRFDYFLRSLPTDLVGRRCEQLMKAAEKEVEQLEKRVREDEGIVVDENTNESDLPPVKLPMYKELRRRWRKKEQDEAEKQRVELEAKVEEMEAQMREVQSRMKTLNQYTREAKSSISSMSADFPEDLVGELANLVAKSGSLGIVGVANKFLAEHTGSSISRRKVVSKIEEIAVKEKREDEGDTAVTWYIRDEHTSLLDVDTLKLLRQSKEEKLQKVEETNAEKQKEDDPAEIAGATGPDGSVLEFPDYDGEEEPRGKKKKFTLYCNSIRKEVKGALPPEKRRNKEIVHRILRERWLRLSEEDKEYWQKMEAWDLERFTRDSAIYAKAQASRKRGPAKAKKRVRPPDSDTPQKAALSIPKKRKS